MAGLLSSLFDSDPDAQSGPESNMAYVPISSLDEETSDTDGGTQSVQSFSISPNDPTDGGAGDASLIGPPTDAYLESQ